MNTEASPAPVSQNASATDDKTVAIVSYLTLIGFIIAIVMHSSKKTKLGAYHLRQSLGLMLASIALAFAGMILAFIPILGWLVDLALWFGLIALWFTGFLAAVKGECKPIALVGQHFEKWFGNTFE